MLGPARDFERIERAIRFIDAERSRQPRLGEVAAHVGLSAFHLQRLFGRWAGVSPKRFLQFLTAEHARRLLAEGGRGALGVSLDVGLSGPGRLHDLLVGVHAVTPGEARGLAFTIRFGVHDGPFGRCLLAATARGICGLAFAAPGGEDGALDELRARWPRAEWRRDDDATAPLAARIFAAALSARDPARPGGSADQGGPPAPLTLLLRGTNFQLQVWQALLDVPAGAVTSYGRLAERIGMPRAGRAVGAAVGANPVAYLIPCHRVIRETGALGGYRWGRARKQALLGWESAARDRAGCDPADAVGSAPPARARRATAVRP
jgi:AraC family transcriptional regulator of adaptative response/methylated-DNA-[protein]-cysteine methyltransferase